MLELRPNCELCDCDLPADTTRARICTYECTFCDTCVETVLLNVCPNCGGGFASRPVRPLTAHRAGVGLGHHPAGTERKHVKHTQTEIRALTAQLKNIPPHER